MSSGFFIKLIGFWCLFDFLQKARNEVLSVVFFAQALFEIIGIILIDVQLYFHTVD